MPKYIIDIRTELDHEFVEDSHIDDVIRQSVSAPSNWKDPEKIANKVEELALQKLEQGGQNPCLGRVSEVGLMHLDPGRSEFISVKEDCEELLLRDVGEEIAQWEGMVTWVGWGLRKRVLPFLATRMAIHSVKWPSRASLDPKDWKNIVDLKDDFNLPDRIEFDWWALRFGMEPPGPDLSAKMDVIREIGVRFERIFSWKFNR